MTKPFDLDEFMLRVYQFCHLKPTGDEPVLGLSPGMRKIEALLTRLADSVEPMLISGESGVGKEVVARLLHEKSTAHRGGERVAVNCAAIPEALIEAELFGYVRGAFTGAARAHKGFIEQGQRRDHLPRRNWRHAVEHASAPAARTAGRPEFIGLRMSALRVLFPSSGWTLRNVALEAQFGRPAQVACLIT
jgi:hypothetical protein